MPDNSTSEHLFFNAEPLGHPKLNYVAWIDMMGAQNAMSQSLQSAANHIGRIHAAILEAVAEEPEIVAYPLIDGAYITAPKKRVMTKTLKKFFLRCAEYFAETETFHHRFLIRGGLAYGPVYHGSEITTACNPKLGARSSTYAKNLLFGIPMVQAHCCERFASPFGLHIHDSARSFSSAGSKPFSGVNWKWWADSELPENFRVRLKEHFEYCKMNWRNLQYDEKRMIEHYDMATQEFRLDEL